MSYSYPEKLLNSNEVAEILNLSRSYVYQLMRSGELNVVKMGRSVRCRVEDLEKYIQQNLSVCNEN